MGPLRQLSKMFEKGRIVATLVYLVFMALTLFCAIKVRMLLCATTLACPSWAINWRDVLSCSCKAVSLTIIQVWEEDMSGEIAKAMCCCNWGHSQMTQTKMTIQCAMQLQSLILTLICFLVQLLAMVWYSLSFIVSHWLRLPYIMCPGIQPSDHPQAGKVSMPLIMVHRQSVSLIMSDSRQAM